MVVEVRLQIATYNRKEGVPSRYYAVEVRIAGEQCKSTGGVAVSRVIFIVLKKKKKKKSYVVAVLFYYDVRNTSERTLKGLKGMRMFQEIG